MAGHRPPIPPSKPTYDGIGAGYDDTRGADPYIVDRLALLLDVHPGGAYLDLGCGTGSYTVALSRRGGRWMGLDPSATMLEAARRKSTEIGWHIGDAENMPLEDGSFDGVVCSLAIHHFHDLRRAALETRRVLREGKLVIFTATPDQMREYWLNAYFPEAMARSVAQMPDLDAVEDACAKAGFRPVVSEPYFVRPDLADGFLYYGKHRPEVYLGAAGRAGISTFRALGDAAEVERGGRRLEDDLRTGAFGKVMAGFDDSGGDYMFITASTSPGNS
jgi:SAM-dependent methyltransferase